MTPPSPALMLAACLALDVTPRGDVAGRLTLIGPDEACASLAPIIRTQRAAFAAFLADESARGAVRQRDGFRVVRVYDVGADLWDDVPRDDPRARLEDCRQHPQRAAILAAFARAITPDLEAAA